MDMVNVFPKVAGQLRSSFLDYRKTRIGEVNFDALPGVRQKNTKVSVQE
ncbi:hypothetical protein ES702_01573 [subsurface metagenome]